MNNVFSDLLNEQEQSKPKTDTQKSTQTSKGVSKGVSKRLSKKVSKPAQGKLTADKVEELAFRLRKRQKRNRRSY